MTKAFIYTSHSVGKEVNVGDSSINQSIRCQRYAESKGYEVVHVCHENAAGATDYWNVMIRWAEQYTANGHDVRIVMDNPRSMPTLLHDRHDRLAMARRLDLPSYDIEFVDGYIEPEVTQVPFINRGVRVTTVPGSQELLDNCLVHSESIGPAPSEPESEICPRKDFEDAREDLIVAMRTFSTFLKGFMGVMVK